MHTETGTDAISKVAQQCSPQQPQLIGCYEARTPWQEWRCHHNTVQTLSRITLRGRKQLKGCRASSESQPYSHLAGTQHLYINNATGQHENLSTALNVCFETAELRTNCNTVVLVFTDNALYRHFTINSHAYGFQSRRSTSSEYHDSGHVLVSSPQKCSPQHPDCPESLHPESSSGA